MEATFYETRITCMPADKQGTATVMVAREKRATTINKHGRKCFVKRF